MRDQDILPLIMEKVDQYIEAHTEWQLNDFTDSGETDAVLEARANTARSELEKTIVTHLM